MDKDSDPLLEKPKTSEKSNSFTSSSAGASLLIILQVGSRALTFVVNQVLLRYLSPELLATSKQLELYSISVLFLATESLRVAIQREGDVESDNISKNDKEVVLEAHVDRRTAAERTQTIVNLSYISIFLGAVLAYVFAISYMRSGDPTILDTPYFGLSLMLFGFAAVWELLSEPGFVVVQQKSRFKIRAAAESVATVLRCLVTCGCAIWAARNGEDLGVLPFALGQIFYSVALVVVYCWGAWDIATLGGFSLKLTPIRSSAGTGEKYKYSYFYKPLLSLGGSLFLQSILKHFLTQGDAFIISCLALPQAQGIYALAANYGGLVARLILQPIEESSRNYFGKLLSCASNPEPSREAISEAHKSLHTLLRSYILLSVGVVAVGPTIAPLLLKIVAGSQWTSSGAGHVLATYCFYIPLLAINGLTEAFVSTVATLEQVNYQSLWMLAFSAGFGGAAFFFLRVLDMGAEGLVWANTLNMVFRIIWSSAFISSYLKKHDAQLDIGMLMPRPMTLAAGAGTYAVMAQLKLTGGILDILKSGSVAAGFVVMLAIGERAYLLDCYRSVRG